MRPHLQVCIAKSARQGRLGSSFCREIRILLASHICRKPGFQGRERRGGRRLTKYAEGNIWLGAARASSRLIGLWRGRGRLRHPSPAPLFPKVCLLPKPRCLFVIHLGSRSAIKSFSPFKTLARWHEWGKLVFWLIFLT